MSVTWEHYLYGVIDLAKPKSGAPVFVPVL